MTAAQRPADDAGCCAPPPSPERAADDEPRLFPTPERITWALDAAGLFGPEADARLGVAEPTVDLWEAGTLGMTARQVEQLAALAGVLPSWLFGTEPLMRVPAWMCFSRKVDGSRCHYVTPEVPDTPEQRGTLF